MQYALSVVTGSQYCCENSPSQIHPILHRTLLTMQMYKLYTGAMVRQENCFVRVTMPQLAAASTTLMWSVEVSITEAVSEHATDQINRELCLWRQPHSPSSHVYW